MIYGFGLTSLGNRYGLTGLGNGYGFELNGLQDNRIWFGEEDQIGIIPTIT